MTVYLYFALHVFYNLIPKSHLLPRVSHDAIFGYINPSFVQHNLFLTGPWKAPGCFLVSSCTLCTSFWAGAGVGVVTSTEESSRAVFIKSVQKCRFVHRHGWLWWRTTHMGLWVVVGVIEWERVWLWRELAKRICLWVLGKVLLWEWVSVWLVWVRLVTIVWLWLEVNLLVLWWSIFENKCSFGYRGSVMGSFSLSMVGVSESVFLRHFCS